jgi:hypothetical protein
MEIRPGPQAGRHEKLPEKWLRCIGPRATSSVRSIGYLLVGKGFLDVQGVEPGREIRRYTAVDGGGKTIQGLMRRGLWISNHLRPWMFSAVKALLAMGLEL